MRLENTAHRIPSFKKACKTNIVNVESEVQMRAGEMEKNIKDMDTRLKVLEGSDGDKWRKVTSAIVTAVISILIGFIFGKMGM